MRQEKTCKELIVDRLEKRLAEVSLLDTLRSGSDCLEPVLLICEDIGYPASQDAASIRQAYANDEDSSEWDNILQDVTEMYERSLQDNILSIDTLIEYDVCLSTGGPADGYKLYWDKNNRCWSHGKYYYKDWYDGAESHLSADDAENIANAYGIYVEGE